MHLLAWTWSCLTGSAASPGGQNSLEEMSLSLNVEASIKTILQAQVAVKTYSAWLEVLLIRWKEETLDSLTLLTQTQTAELPHWSIFVWVAAEQCSARSCHGVKPVQTVDPEDVGQQINSADTVQDFQFVTSSRARWGWSARRLCRVPNKDCVKGVRIWSLCQHVSATTTVLLWAQIPKTAEACKQLRTQLCSTNTDETL